VYKGHVSKAAYLRWCQIEWDKAHPQSGSLLSETLAEYVQAFCSGGAVGQSDIYEWRTEDGNIARAFVFVHLLPAAADALADRFYDAVLQAVGGGYVGVPTS
jgi:hypothetical protein